MSKYIKKAIIVAMGIVISLLVIEFSLRVFLGLGKPPLLVSNENIGYYFKANQKLRRFGNVIIYNEYHQRNNQLIQNPDYRIMMVGDSIINGGALTDQSNTISQVLEKRLSQYCDCKVEVINASAGSWAIENEYRYLLFFGLFKSEIVIWGIGTNDLFQQKSTKSSVGKLNMPNQYPPTAIYELFARYLLPKAQEFLRRFIVSPSNEEFQAEDNVVSERSEENFEKNINLLSKGIEFIQNNNINVIILLIPEREEINAHKFYAERDFLIQLLRKKSIPFIDLIDENYRLKKEYFRDNVHFNARGNYHIAKVLFDYILSRSFAIIGK